MPRPHLAQLPAIFAFALGVTLVPLVAHGQAPNGSVGAPLPVATDLKAVPVGSWAQYRVSDGSANTVAVRIALVARSAKEAQVETQISGGPMRQGGKTTMRMTVPTDVQSGTPPRSHVVQVGDNDPMELPSQMASAAQPFTKPDPKKKIASETVNVPAGSFKVDHYRDKAADGRTTIDFWIASNVYPFGMVKMTSSGSASGQQVTMELAARGSDAKPAITKSPKAFDAQAMMRQMQPLTGAGPGGPPGPGAGAAAAAPSSPAGRPAAPAPASAPKK